MPKLPYSYLKQNQPKEPPEPPADPPAPETPEQPEEPKVLTKAEQLAELLADIRKSGKSCIDLPNGDIMVSYRDANRRTFVVVFSGQNGRTIAVGVQ